METIEASTMEDQRGMDMEILAYQHWENNWGKDVEGT